MSIINFLIALRREVSVFTDTTLDRESLTYDNRRLNIINQILVSSYYRLLEYYFRTTDITGDTNFFTEDEIREVIDRLNNIMKTYLYTDFS
jgi:hypothetical protein